MVLTALFDSMWKILIIGSVMTCLDNLICVDVNVGSQ